MHINGGPRWSLLSSTGHLERCANAAVFEFAMTRPHERIGLVTIIAMDDISRCCLLEVVVDVHGRRVARARDGGAVGTEVVPVVGAEFVGIGSIANLAEGKLALARVGLLAEAAEDTVVEGELVLPLGVASTHLGVGPVDLVGLADDHVLAVLPIVVRLLGGGEVGVLRAPAAEVGGATGCSEELAANGGLAGVVLRGGGAV